MIGTSPERFARYRDTRSRLAPPDYIARKIDTNITSNNYGGVAEDAREARYRLTHIMRVYMYVFAVIQTGPD